MTNETPWGEPFAGTGSPPMGWQDGDECQCDVVVTGHWANTAKPSWHRGSEFRLRENHPHYHQWALDKAAREAIEENFEFVQRHCIGAVKSSIIAHAKTLIKYEAPPPEPVDRDMEIVRQAIVDVAQADRIAAGPFANSLVDMQDIFDGKSDGLPIVQAFARHRQLTLAVAKRVRQEERGS